MLRAKLHRLTVTQADLDYEGSITLPPELMEAAGIVQYEEVQVWNVTRGTRFATYVIEGERGEYPVQINGAAAHLAKPGDIIIAACFALVSEEELKEWHPYVILVDDKNRLREVRRHSG
jgi:aspartate 1-decarboxylase